MIAEEDLLNEIKKGIEECRTLHYVIIDSSVCLGDINKISQRSLNNKNLAWWEPQEGVYIINTHLLSHFNNYFDNLLGLMQKIVNCGYLVKTLRFKKVLPQKRFKFKNKLKNSPERIAIVTMFSNKAFVEHWKTFLKETLLPPGVMVDVIMGDNRDDHKIKDLLHDIKNTCGLKYNNYYTCDLGKSYQSKINEHYLDIDKHVHVAVNYSELLREPSLYYDYILKIEDDVEPPNDGFLQLHKHIKSLEKEYKVSCVAGYYPQKLNPNTACISLQAKIWGKIPKLNEIPKELFPVEMQGGGFALYKCKALREVLPYKLTFKLPGGHYYMTGWDGTIGEEWSNNGWKQFCDGNLFCKHHWEII